MIDEQRRIIFLGWNLAAREGRATAYVCVNYCCRLPTADAGKMLALLNASG
ncbi:MAG: hypothetical protein AB1507_00380 [Bacillota bacterium]|nr:hypothetical protein [Thermoanaerobacteraceae bacterium]